MYVHESTGATVLKYLSGYWPGELSLMLYRFDTAGRVFL
jgi:hypothetical protein